MFENVHSLFLVIVVVVFGLQAVWGVSTGKYLRRSGFKLVTMTKFDHPVEYGFVTVIFSIVAISALIILLIKMLV